MMMTWAFPLSYGIQSNASDESPAAMPSEKRNPDIPSDDEDYNFTWGMFSIVAYWPAFQSSMYQRGETVPAWHASRADYMIWAGAASVTDY